MNRHVKEYPVIWEEQVRFVKHDNTDQDTQCQMLLKFVPVIHHVIKHVNDTQVDPCNIDGLSYPSIHIVSPVIEGRDT